MRPGRRSPSELSSLTPFAHLATDDHTRPAPWRHARRRVDRRGDFMPPFGACPHSPGRRSRPVKDIARRPGGRVMCRNIRTLHNFEPPATGDEIRASSLQFVRKLSGFARPSKANEAAFNRAVEQVAAAACVLMEALVATADPRDREIEAARAKAKSAARFG